MKTPEFEWRLYAPMVLKILQDSEYLMNRGLRFELRNNTIYRTGGWMYSPSEIRSFNDALDVLRDNACAVSVQFDAICILEGASFQSILDKGRRYLAELFPDHVSLSV